MGTTGAEGKNLSMVFSFRKNKRQSTPMVSLKDSSGIPLRKQPPKGITGEILLQLIESRLDNVVFRLGISPSRRGARQLVSHRHITVNGTVANVPSYEVKPGDVIGVREKSKALEAITDSLSGRTDRYPWLEWDDDKMEGKFVSYPAREDIPENIREQLIVELYSK
jgi:small subunit ribosomal protein S4